MQHGEVIGAADGKETNYVFVEWQVNGDMNEVHGRPITVERLRQKGAEV